MIDDLTITKQIFHNLATQKFFLMSSVCFTKHD